MPQGVAKGVPPGGNRYATTMPICLLTQFPGGTMPNATRISMQTETRSQSPGGRYDNSPTFEGWVRSTEDPTSPKRDGRLQLQGISVRTDIEHPAFSRPVGTPCNLKFVVPNLQRLGYCQPSLRDKSKILVALGGPPAATT